MNDTENIDLGVLKVSLGWCLGRERGGGVGSERRGVVWTWGGGGGIYYAAGLVCVNFEGCLLAPVDRR